MISFRRVTFTKFFLSPNLWFHSQKKVSPTPIKKFWGRLEGLIWAGMGWFQIGRVSSSHKTL